MRHRRFAPACLALEPRLALSDVIAVAALTGASVGGAADALAPMPMGPPMLGPDDPAAPDIVVEGLPQPPPLDLSPLAVSVWYGGDAGAASDYLPPPAGP